LDPLTWGADEARELVKGFPAMIHFPSFFHSLPGPFPGAEQRRRGLIMCQEWLRQPWGSAARRGMGGRV